MNKGELFSHPIPLQEKNVLKQSFGSRYMFFYNPNQTLLSKMLSIDRIQECGSGSGSNWNQIQFTSLDPDSILDPDPGAKFVLEI